MSPMPPTLTILGASVRLAAQSARRAGFAVVAGDLFGDRDLVAAAERVRDYPAGLLPVCAGPQSGPWMYAGGLENHPQLVERLAAQRPLLGNGAAVLRAVRDPSRVWQVFQDHGLSAPRVAISPADLPRDGSWLRKPLRSAGGTDIARWSGATDAADVSRRWYYQQFIAGEPRAAVYLAAAGHARLLGSTRQLIGPAWTGADGFRYAGSLGPGVEVELLGQLERMGEVLAGEFSLEGLFGVDYIYDGAAAWPVEVNPRLVASVEVIERAKGFSAVAFHVQACERGVLPAAPDVPRGVSGKAILFANRPITPRLEWLKRLEEENQAGPWPRWADIPQAGRTIGPGEPILTILADGDDEQCVLADLHARAARLRAAAGLAEQPLNG